MGQIHNHPMSANCTFCILKKLQLPCPKYSTTVSFCTINYTRKNTGNIAVLQNLCGQREKREKQQINEKKQDEVDNKHAHEMKLTVLMQLSADSAITSTVITTSLRRT